MCNVSSTTSEGPPSFRTIFPRDSVHVLFGCRCKPVYTSCYGIKLIHNRSSSPIMPCLQQTHISSIRHPTQALSAEHMYSLVHVIHGLLFRQGYITFDFG